MSVSHSHIRTKKRSIPNLHVITVRVDGKNKTMRLCTKCTRIVRKLYPHSQELVAKIEKKETAKTVSTEIADEKVKAKEEVVETA